MLALEMIALNSEEQEIHDLALRRSAEYQRAEAQLLESIEQVDRLRLFEKFGLTSTFSYCTKLLKLSEAVSYCHITVARKTRSVPELKLAIETGEVPVSKAAKIASVLTPENQSEWIAMAKNLSKNELEKKVAEASPKKAKRPSVKPVGENRTRVSFEVDDEFIADLKRVCELESQRTAKAVSSPEEALKAALKDYLKRHDPVQKAERAKKKTRPKAKPAKPLFPGRARGTTRAVVVHQVNLRDRGCCRVKLPDGQICGSSQWTEIHHLTRVADGGLDELSNLITVCRAHHAMVHAREETLS